MTIVELFERQQSARRRLLDQEYDALHQGLLQECQSRAESTSGAERAHYESLIDLIRPWLTLSALARADREILLDLRQRCQQTARELGLLPRFHGASKLVPALASVLVAVSAALFGFFWGMEQLPIGTPDDLRIWMLSMWLSITRLSSLQRLGILAAVVVVLAIYLVSRTARS